ncbi:MAG TPA: hypothetical protein VHF51_01405 [Solirubrobacteraceae bacterium]|nr:hypothetical protein [Solirubrobacteraceae bacterium]
MHDRDELTRSPRARAEPEPLRDPAGGAPKAVAVVGGGLGMVAELVCEPVHGVAQPAGVLLAELLEPAALGVGDARLDAELSRQRGDVGHLVRAAPGVAAAARHHALERAGVRPLEQRDQLGVHPVLAARRVGRGERLERMTAASPSTPCCAAACAEPRHRAPGRRPHRACRAGGSTAANAPAPGPATSAGVRRPRPGTGAMSATSANAAPVGPTSAASSRLSAGLELFASA